MEICRPNVGCDSLSAQACAGWVPAPLLLFLFSFHFILPSPLTSSSMFLVLPWSLLLSIRSNTPVQTSHLPPFHLFHALLSVPFLSSLDSSHFHLSQINQEAISMLRLALPLGKQGTVRPLVSHVVRPSFLTVRLSTGTSSFPLLSLSLYFPFPLLPSLSLSHFLFSFPLPFPFPFSLLFLLLIYFSSSHYFARC